MWNISEINDKKKERHKHKIDQVTEGSNQLGYDKKYVLNIKNIISYIFII